MHSNNKEKNTERVLMRRIFYRSVLPATLLILMVAATPQPSLTQQRYALIIGVTGYPNFPEQGRLRFADDDAQLFYEFIQTDEGGNFEQNKIKLLLNEQATRRKIIQEINWLSHNARSKDRVYIYFAGHGIVSDEGRAYFIPYEGLPSEPNVDGIRADEFLNRINSIVAKEVVVFIDACHAAAALNSDGTSRSAESGTEENLAGGLKEKWKAVTREPGETFMALFSASDRQRSWEDHTLKHGVFTYYLIKGLQGRADTDNDGFVKAGELLDYLSDEVDAWTRQKFKKRQTPIPSPGFDPDFIFTIYEPEPPPPETTTSDPTPEEPSETHADPPPPETIFSAQAMVSGDHLGRLIREETAKELINITYADSTDRLASISVHDKDQGGIAAYVTFAYHPDGYLEVMNSLLAPLEIWSVEYKPNKHLGALKSYKGRQIVFYYGETPDATALSDTNTVHVMTNETILIAIEAQTAQQVAFVFTLLKKLSGADTNTLFKIVNRKLIPDPAEIHEPIKITLQ